MMTSSNGNIFHVTGPLWWEFTGDRWIPLTKASDMELWCFLSFAPEQTVGQTIRMQVIWDNHRIHYDITVCNDILVQFAWTLYEVQKKFLYVGSTHDVPFEFTWLHDICLQNTYIYQYISVHDVWLCSWFQISLISVWISMYYNILNFIFLHML